MSKVSRVCLDLRQKGSFLSGVYKVLNLPPPPTPGEGGSGIYQAVGEDYQSGEDGLGKGKERKERAGGGSGRKESHGGGGRKEKDIKERRLNLIKNC